MARKTNRDVRKFLRKVGVKPTAENVDRIGLEIGRTQSEHERVQERAREVERETGRPALIDAKGDPQARIRAAHARMDRAEYERRQRR